MKKAAIIVGAILGGLVLLALAVPAMIDWNQWKAPLLARAEQALGRHVAIDGPLSVRLLPRPTVIANRVRLANVEGASVPDMATVEAIRLRLDLLPLLTGRLEIDPLVLDRPVVSLQRLADGRANWEFTPAAAPAPDNTTPSPPTATKGEDGSTVRLGGIVIQNGTVTWQDGAAAPLTIGSIDAEIEGAQIASAGLGGPLTARGDLRWNDRPVEFEAMIEGAATPGHATRAALTLGLPTASAKLSVSGLISALDAGPTLRGRLRAEAKSARRLAAGLPEAPLTAEAVITLNREEAALQDLVATLGDSHGTGSIVASLGTKPVQLDATLRVASLDLDRLLATAPSATPEPAPAPPRTALPAAPAPSPAAASGFALPEGLAAHLDLGIDTLSWRDGVVREARIDAMVEDGQVTISRASAQLPGASTVLLEGTIVPRDGRPAFDGRLQAGSDNLRALLGWLKVETGRIPEGRLRRLTLQGKLSATPETVALAGLDVGIDSTRLRGEATARLEGRQRFALDLAADALNLDAYLPPRKTRHRAEAAPEPADPPPASTAPAPSSPAPAAPALPAETRRVLSDFDATLRLKLGQLVLNEVSATGLAFDAALESGNLTIREAGVGDLAGASAKAQGVVQSLASPAPKLEQLSLELRSGQPARLFRFLGIGGSIAPERLAPLAVNATLDGDWNAIAVKARASAAGLEASADGRLAAPLDAGRRIDLAVAVRHASTAQLIRLFSEGYRPQGGTGAFALEARLTGEAEAVDIGGISLRAGEARITGQAQVVLGHLPAITAELAGNAIDLDPFLPTERSGLWLPLPGGLHGPGGTVPAAASAVLPAAEGLPGPWTRKAFDLGALRGFDAKLGLTAQAVSWQGWRLDGAAARLAVDQGAAVLERLSGRLLGGELAASARLGGGALPAFTGSVAVTGANLDKAQLGLGGLKVTKGLLTADARWATAGRSSWDMASNLSGDGRLSVRDGVLAGFDLPAVGQRIKNVENVGSLIGLAQAGLTGGSTRFSALTGTFRAEAGIVTSRDVKLDAEGGGATAESRTDLPRWTTDTRIGFRLADSAAPPLVLRLEGPLDNPRKIVDVNDLQRHLVERGLGRALKGKDGGVGLIETLTGRKPKDKQAAPAPGEPGAEAPQKDKPADVLKGLLKGLVR